MRLKMLNKWSPVAQSIVSLMSSLVIKMLTILVSKISNSHVFLLKKMWVAFANVKATHIFFSKNISLYAIFNDQNFNDTLIQDIFSFEQLGPSCHFSIFNMWWGENAITYTSWIHTYMILTPLNPLLYSKTGVYRTLFFLFLLKIIDCGYSLELPLMSTHNVCFEQNYEKYQNYLSENFQFLVVKISIYLNRCSFLM